MGRSFRLPISTSSPSRKMIDRKPSHLGSKLYEPVGISATDLASMGGTGGITGRRMRLSSPTPGLDRESVTKISKQTTRRASEPGLQRSACVPDRGAYRAWADSGRNRPADLASRRSCAVLLGLDTE